MVLFGISDAVWLLWWCFNSYISVSFSDIGWICLDDWLLKVFRLLKLRRSFGHMERMHSFRGIISLAENNALLALWWFWNLISLLRSFWFWLWKVILVIWWKVHVETHDVNCNIHSSKDLFKFVNPLGWVVESKYVNPLGWVFESHMSLGDRKVIESCTSLKNMFEDSAWTQGEHGNFSAHQI